MTIVVDASMAAAWLLPDEFSEASDRIFRLLQATDGLVPSIFRHEVRHILLIAERRKRVMPAKVDELLGRLAALPVRDGGHSDDHDVIALARTGGLTAYDAALALSTGSSLATLDRAMAAAARTHSLAILGPYATPSP